MKAFKFLRISILFALLAAIGFNKVYAQDSAAPKTQLNISYFLPANQLPYLEVTTRKKVGRKFEPVKNIPVRVYFNEPDPNNLLGKVITDSTGEGRIGFPPAFKSIWDSTNEFKFVAESEQIANEEQLSADITIKKAILTIDTTSEDGIRTVIAELKEKNGDNWQPVKDVEMIIAVKRSLGNLSVGDKETYTSDSSGITSAEFQRDSIPGNENGNITLVAHVVDNDTYGNLAIEKSVNWGMPAVNPDNFFAKRTLWSIRTKTPLWLLLTVYAIVLGVWGTFLYLIFQVIKIKRLGTQE